MDIILFLAVGWFALMSAGLLWLLWRVVDRIEWLAYEASKVNEHLQRLTACAACVDQDRPWGVN